MVGVAELVRPWHQDPNTLAFDIAKHGVLDLQRDVPDLVGDLRRDALRRLDDGLGRRADVGRELTHPLAPDSSGPRPLEIEWTLAMCASELSIDCLPMERIDRVTKSVQAL